MAKQSIQKKKRKKRSQKAGLPPGTMVYIGDPKSEPIHLSAFVYNEATFETYEVNSALDWETFISNIRPKLTAGDIAWINVDGIHDIQLIEKVGKEFGLHPLVLEDIVNTTQRPKRGEYETYTHVVVRTLNLVENSIQIESEQLSFILAKNFVLSFQERRGDCFDAVRERVRTGKGRARKHGPDYLFYALVDSIVDHYFVILETLGEKTEDLEDALLEEAPPSLMHELHVLKKNMLFLRRAVWPLREVIVGCEREESPFITESTRVYFRDLYDHTIEVIEIVESLRDLASGMIELYLSQVSNKVNSVMKTLTVIATIFMPLTFIVGVYGMNFDVMPELRWRWGYPSVMALMLFIALGMLYHFRRRNWV